MEDFEPLVEFETKLSKTKKRAMNILGARVLTRGAMEKRLKELGESDEDAADAADWLVEIGLIDDAAYAAELVRGCVRRGFGARRIRDEMYRRLVPRELWDDALAEIEDGETVASAEAFIERKLRGETPDFDDKRKIGAALARRGHSWSDINAAFANYIEGLDEENEEEF
ncbi:MAG: recombination regulator RecX [Oscillospiraceae bacterium]|jgi:regulatory protein|nr:recombination regulator RecX [Oscillospiraceae bacterium]